MTMHFNHQQTVGRVYHPKITRQNVSNEKCSHLMFNCPPLATTQTRSLFHHFPTALSMMHYVAFPFSPHCMFLALFQFICKVYLNDQ